MQRIGEHDATVAIMAADLTVERLELDRQLLIELYASPPRPKVYRALCARLHDVESALLAIGVGHPPASPL